MMGYVNRSQDLPKDFIRKLQQHIGRIMSQRRYKMRNAAGRKAKPYSREVS